MRRYYVGLACTSHDAAISIVDDRGTVLFAEGTERYLQCKRALSFTPDIRGYADRLLREYCEPGSHLVLAKSWSSAYATQEGIASESERLGMAALSLRNRMHLRIIERAGEAFELAAHLRGDTVVSRGYNHHLTHAALNCYTGPFPEAACAVVDGFGERSATAFYRFRDGQIERIPAEPTLQGASPGFYYATLCMLCGFDPIQGEEWKVMGLAAYGKFREDVYAVLKNVLHVDGLCVKGDITRKDFLGLRAHYREDRQKAADLAHTGQQFFGEIMTELLNTLHRQVPSDHLVFGGGCALNSAYNGRITAETPFQNVHVFSAPADDGCALGASFLAFCEENSPSLLPRQLLTPYLGASLSSETIEHLQQYGGLGKATRLSVDDLADRASDLLIQGKILGWARGRAEFGPRALGNRSILAAPFPASMKAHINECVKFREEFRPFAPAVLEQHRDQFFDGHGAAPYMERAAIFKPEARARVPAVVHEDYTGRLQTVRADWNPGFHRLIEAFAHKTDVPVVLNTSFNVMGKPIVHSVEDAVATFMTTGIDALVLEDTLFEKSSR